MGNATVKGKKLQKRWQHRPRMCRNPAAAREQRNFACYECGSSEYTSRVYPCDQRGTGNANAVNNQRVTVASQKAICYECGNQGHYKEGLPRANDTKALITKLEVLEHNGVGHLP
ncbi:hypothetical protein Tco_0706600 [Tanacetum coccineum]|uniref:CCHC-type domain-containing protein n=1 Tax=Tanacetum coccineum TaxID=301880 RepID=A0ABQ4Y7U7_9ASTR